MAGLAALLSGLIVQEAADGKLLHFNWVGIMACVVTVAAVWVVQHIRTVA